MYRKLAVIMVVVATMAAAVGLGTRGAQAGTPVAHAGGPYSGVVGAPVQFNGSASTGIGLVYTWYFGDNTTGAGITPTHVYAAPGTYFATLVVTDIDGAVAQHTATVQISGAAWPGAGCYWTVAGWSCAGAAPYYGAGVNCAGPWGWTHPFCAGFIYAPALVSSTSSATLAQMCNNYPWFLAEYYRMCSQFFPR